jgi:hypothetical protein
MANIGKRPGVVLAAAILLFVFGSFSVLRGCCGVFSEVLQGPIQGMMPQPPAVQGKKPVDINRRLAEEVPSKVYVLSTFHVIDFLLGIVKIIVGIGLLKMSSPARVLAFIVAGFTIFETIAESLYNVLVFMPAFERVFAEHLKNAPPMPIDFGALFKGSSWVGAALGIIVSLGIWLTVIFLLSGERVRTAFADAGKEPPEPEKRRKPRYEGYEDEDEGDRPPSPPDTGITDRPSPLQAPPDTGFTDRPS